MVVGSVQVGPCGASVGCVVLCVGGVVVRGVCVLGAMYWCDDSGLGGGVWVSVTGEVG